MQDLRKLFRRMMELCQPDLRKYYRMPRKGRIEVAYVSAGGQWYADVQPLRNDESPDLSEPVLPKLELPVLWGGKNRGVVCPPEKGTLCTITYWDGDPSYPYISDLRWFGKGAPAAELTEFIIQQGPGIHIKIDKKNNVITVTPTDIQDTAKNWTVNVGDEAKITVGKVATVRAPTINLFGNLNCAGDEKNGIGAANERSHRKHKGSYDLDGPQSISGNLKVAGTVTAAQFIGPVQGCAGCGGGGGGG